MTTEDLLLNVAETMAFNANIYGVESVEFKAVRTAMRAAIFESDSEWITFCENMVKPRIIRSNK